MAYNMKGFGGFGNSASPAKSKFGRFLMGRQKHTAVDGTEVITDKDGNVVKTSKDGKKVKYKKGSRPKNYMGPEATPEETAEEKYDRVNDNAFDSNRSM